MGRLLHYPNLAVVLLYSFRKVSVLRSCNRAIPEIIDSQWVEVAFSVTVMSLIGEFSCTYVNSFGVVTVQHVVLCSQLSCDVFSSRKCDLACFQIILGNDCVLLEFEQYFQFTLS